MDSEENLTTEIKKHDKRIIDLTGQKFGELTVIRRATKEERPKEVYWLCKCSCGNDSFVKTGNLKFDFVIFDNEDCIVQIIETDGKQHYEPIKWFGGEKSFEVSQLRDKIKDKYCKTHNIPLLRLPYYLNKEEMKNEIEKVI